MDKRISSMAMQTLEPLALPLNNNALIEASAGTGKTYTITTLYLRAILGLIAPINESEQLSPLSIEQILVVTFTEAATQEIKARVRAKLIEAQSYLISSNNLAVKSQFDPNLTELIKRYVEIYLKLHPQQEEHAAKLNAYHRLQNAITLIDEASIFTIHGFCHRCLKQFAFETNSSFEQEFEMDSKPTLYKALLDFWRSEVHLLSESDYYWFSSTWKTPNALYGDLKDILARDVTITPAIDSDRFEALTKDHDRLIVELKTQWRQAKFTDILLTAKLNKRKKVYSRIQAVNEFILSDDGVTPFGKGESWQLYSSSSLQDPSNYTKNAECIDHPIIVTIDKLAEVEQQLLEGGIKSYWLTKAKRYIELRTKQLKNEAQLITPDDLLTELLQAIQTRVDNPQSDDTSDVNTPLINAIRNYYPLAFIDEFQDTDQVQYAIFDAIYSQQSKEANVILIGDPKQAIYKFRGADIYTYIEAKQALPDSQQYTLDKNWRSHPNLIQAINKVFMRHDNIFQHQLIPFIDVGAGSNGERKLTLHGQADINLQINHLLPELTDPATLGIKKDQGIEVMAKWCAADIALQLEQADDKTLSISDKQTSKPIKSSDICVLVRDRQQASVIKKSLSELGIMSVFISRDNIFKTKLAKDMFRLLAAIHSPFNENRVRAACATLFFNYDVEQLLALQHQPLEWQHHVLAFNRASELWHLGKITIAINEVLALADTFVNWQQQKSSDAQRLITDLRHLIELIQQQASIAVGPEKLLFWFEQQVIASQEWSDASDEKQLRLESDNNLVQITTLHASKGLEYPIVYLPFVTEYKEASNAIYTSHANEQHQLTYRADNRLIEKQKADAERIEEDLRLLYVAMTRPVYKLVLGVFNLCEGTRSLNSTFAKTAIARLLFGNEIDNKQRFTDEMIASCCEQLIQPSITEYDAKTITQVLNYFETRQPHVDIKQELQWHFEPFSGKVNDKWRLLSYSSIAHDFNHQSLSQPQQLDSLVTAEELVRGMDDEQHELAPNQQSESLELLDQFSFPKGANAGTCLHEILEQVDFQITLVKQQEVIKPILLKFGYSDIWLEPVAHWLQQVLDCNLGHWQLSQLTQRQKLVEMEFYFNFNRLGYIELGNALQMMGVVTHHEQPDGGNQTLLHGVSGMLKGFIDLTVNIDNQYFVLDYKSNYLGDDFESYQTGHLAEAMSDHNYYLQALIYTLALHRYLKQKLSNYDYQQHIGGVYYLFLRGMRIDNDNGIFYLNINQEVIEYLDTCLTGETSTIAMNNSEQKERQQMGFDFD